MTYGVAYGLIMLTRILANCFNKLYHFSRCINGVKLSCENGTYASSDKTSCLSCTKGTYCPSAQLDSPVACSNGTYQDEIGQLQCKECPAGKKCPTASGTPVTCDNGTYSLLGISGCSICPSGHR